jgi:hypothetical protein
MQCPKFFIPSSSSSSSSFEEAAFFDFIGLEGNSPEGKGLAFLTKGKQEVIDNNNPYWIEDNIENFLKRHKERLKKGDIVATTLETYYWPIKVFCDRNKLTLPGDIDWDNLSKIIPKTSSYSNDRCPTVQEIRRVIKNPNRRVKIIVLVMCSSGIRLGAWDYLKWKHVIPITNSHYLHWKKQKEEDENGHHSSSNITITSDDESKIIAAKLIVYNDGEGDNSRQHFSYITPEAYYALKEMIDYREQVQGEKITGESWLITNEKVGFATAPKKLTYNGLRRVLNRTLKTEGLRSVLPEGKRRYEWKQSHGYRKFFETYAGSVMHPYNVKMLIDHKLEGSENSYWKPTELQLLEDYLRAIPKLTINNQDNIDKYVLQKEVAELKEKSEQQNAEKEKEAEETKKELKDVREEISLLKRGFNHLIETGVMEPILRQSADTDR